MAEPLTFLFLATEPKGFDLVRECRALGCRTILITEEQKKDEVWPRESIDQFYAMPDLSNKQHVINAVSYLARENRIDRILALDDYDVEMAATLREHMRLPGMGDTVARHFRDKLAMRGRAAGGRQQAAGSRQQDGLRVPAFAGLFNDEQVGRFLSEVASPWVLKPRSEAGAVGIRKLADAEAVWAALAELGDRRSFFLLEQFVAGEIFHVDSIVFDGEVRFAIVHQYGRPPLSVSHEGGVFTTRTLPRDGESASELRELNGRLLAALGMERGVAHAEFIRGDADSEFYFLEVGARVGGANINETIMAATGVNLWQEWGRLEVAQARGEGYEAPPDRGDYAGIIICLARQEWPDTSAYDDPEVVWRMEKTHHAGVIVASPDAERVRSLLEGYAERFAVDFLAVGPAKAAARVYSA